MNKLLYLGNTPDRKVVNSQWYGRALANQSQILGGT